MVNHVACAVAGKQERPDELNFTFRVLEGNIQNLQMKTPVEELAHDNQRKPLCQRSKSMEALRRSANLGGFRISHLAKDNYGELLEQLEKLIEEVKTLTAWLVHQVNHFTSVSCVECSLSHVQRAKAELGVQWRLTDFKVLWSDSTSSRLQLQWTRRQRGRRSTTSLQGQRCLKLAQSLQ